MSARSTPFVLQAMTGRIGTFLTRGASRCAPACPYDDLGFFTFPTGIICSALVANVVDTVEFLRVAAGVGAAVSARLRYRCCADRDSRCRCVYYEAGEEAEQGPQRG